MRLILINHNVMMLLKIMKMLNVGGFRSKSWIGWEEKEKTRVVRCMRDKRREERMEHTKSLVMRGGQGTGRGQICCDVICVHAT
jgi:hypothetical protein